MMEKGINKKKPIEMKSVKILNQNTFWGQRLQKLREVIVPYQWKILNDDIPGAPKSHEMCIRDRSMTDFINPRARVLSR